MLSCISTKLSIVMSLARYREDSVDTCLICHVYDQCCVFYSPGALTFGYGCTVHVGVDVVGVGDAEVDVIYMSFIMSVQYIGCLVPYKDEVQRQATKTRYKDKLQRQVNS